MTTLLPRPDAAERRTGPLSRLGGRLLQAATYPHGTAGYRDAYRPAASAGRTPAEVVAITPRTRRAHSILLRPARPIAFAPGQHILVTCEVAGVRQTRCYSLSDTPHRADGLLEITVAHIPEGRLSSHLVGGVAVGEAVGLSAPQGHEFVLPLRRPDHLLLIGGGSGITPLRSMWRTMQAEGLADRTTLLYYARTADDAIFADEIATTAGTHVVTTREGDGPLQGRFQPAHLTEIGVDLCDTEVFACGPVGLVEAVRTAVADTGTEAHLHTESFAPPVAPTSDDAEGLITFARSGASAHNDGATLLEQAEAAGLQPEAGCRMGICHTCTTHKHAGAVRDVRTGQVDQREDCEIQLCVTQPVGNVSLDL